MPPLCASITASMRVIISGFATPATPYPNTAWGNIGDVSLPGWNHGYLGAVTYTHSFGSVGVADFAFARDRGTWIGGVHYPSSLASPGRRRDFRHSSPEISPNGASFNPGISINGYLSFGTANVLNAIPYADTNEWKGDMALTHGRHTSKIRGKPPIQ